MVAKPLCPLYKNIIKPLDRARYPELRYLYGSFVPNSKITVKYGEAPLATYTFSQATVNAKSYALDATVVSLANEGIVGLLILL